MPQVMTEQWIEQVAAEHKELRKLLASLRVFLEQPRPEVGAKGCHTWAADLSQRLVGLHDELVRHFRFEEEGGMVEQISLGHPRAARQIEELAADHPAILAKSRDLMSATLAYSEGQMPEDPQLRRRLSALIERLSRHEREETDLIQKLEYQDLGAAD